MAVAGRFYPSFANSFTLCLIWLAFAALHASLQSGAALNGKRSYVWRKVQASAVIPAQAGIQKVCKEHCARHAPDWIPACAGMTAALLFQLRARNRQHAHKHK
jgi:hypothetical protein